MTESRREITASNRIRALENRWAESGRVAGGEAKHASRLGIFALRSRAADIRDLVAHGAGFRSFDEALEAARAGQIPVASPNWLRELGRVAFQLPVPDFANLAVAFYRAALRVDPRMGFRDKDSHAYLEALLLAEGPSSVASELHRHQQMPSIERDFLKVDLVGAEHGYGSQEWLAAINANVFQAAGLSPIFLSDAPGEPFDRLSANPVTKKSAGPLISVIMLTFRRQHEIRVAVQSILNQTWTNLELIIVDDASGDEFTSLLEELSSWDSRIRVIRMSSNGGAYVGRNAALSQVRGEFITFQDDDDWSHPERLERQVEGLLRDREVALTLSLAARATPDLSFRYRGAPAVRANASSVMFRRKDIERVGPYDAVRKAGDSEFIERLAVITGGRQEIVNDVLALVRLSTGSLSRADFSVGWQHPARVEYRESYRHFHRSIEKGEREPGWAGGARPFPAPHRIAGGGALVEARQQVDILILADWRDFGALTLVQAKIASDLAAVNKTVGIAHVPDVRAGGTGQERMAQQARELISSGRVVRVLPDDPVAVGTLVIADAGVLDSLAREPWECAVGSAAVVVQSLPIESDPKATWSTESVRSRLEAVFDTSDLTWLAAHSQFEGLDEYLGARVPVLDMRGAAVGRPSLRRVSDIREVPRVGRYLSRTASVRTPGRGQWEETLSGLPFDVRLYSGLSPRGEYPSGWDPTWLVFGPLELSYSDYLRQLDFYLAIDGGQGSSEEVIAALQAAASGCVVIADSVYEAELGEAAVYCERADILPTINALFSNPEVYTAQVERAISWCDDMRERSLRASGLYGLPRAE